MRRKATAAVTATLALAFGGAALFLGDVPRVCVEVEAEVSCDLIAKYAPAAVSAVSCDGYRQLRLIVTVKRSEAAMTADELIRSAYRAVGGLTRAERVELRKIRLIDGFRVVGKDGQCPQRRLRVLDLDSGCIGGQVTQQYFDDHGATRYRTVDGQCCGPKCSCTGPCCAPVGRTELAGSGTMWKTVCDACPQLARCAP